MALRELDEARHDVEREMAKRILHHMQPVRVHMVKDALFGQVIRASTCLYGATSQGSSGLQAGAKSRWSCRVHMHYKKKISD